MYPNSFFIPNYPTPFMPMTTVPRLGLFSRIGNTIKSVNWSGLLNGADRTLGLVNQTIPLVREAKPMFSNMKSMVKLAKAFRNETSPQRTNIQRQNNIVNTSLEAPQANNNTARFFI